ncbi:MAG: O-succinylbenzoate synthase [Cellulomonas sp. 14-74-6]|nr:MAG: O-succinylbenzoate synthase [Cellulomonas sp. 14-74-6]
MPVPGDLVVWSVPMRTRFRGLTSRDGTLVRGDAGWGEFSPFWDYDDDESRRWWLAAREAADQGWPAPLRDRIPVNVTVPAVDAATAHRIVRASGGCTTAKVKVAEPGQSSADDEARLEAVRDALGPDGAIRVDANTAWDVDTAAARLTALDRAAGGLQYAEQPVRTVDELAALRRRTHVPVAADESVRRAADPLEVARRHAADVVVLKVQPLGGVRACLRLAEQLDVPVVVSSALESSVGLAAGLALAAALPELPYACGLATAALLTHDLVTEPLLPRDGAIDVRRPMPEPDLLTAAAAAPGLEARWRERVARVAGAARAPRA